MRPLLLVHLDLFPFQMPVKYPSLDFSRTFKKDDAALVIFAS